MNYFTYTQSSSQNKVFFINFGKVFYRDKDKANKINMTTYQYHQLLIKKFNGIL